MASPELDTAINMFRSAKAETQSLATMDEFRLWYEQFTAQFPMEDDAVYEPVAAGGVHAEWIYGPDALEDRVLVWLHGGGYIIGSMRTHRAPLSRLSKASGARVLGLNYRMAPEHPFPAAVQDSVAAYRWLLSSGINPKSIVIGGDSAGGGLTAATLIALRYEGDPMPAAGILHSGWTDLSNSGDTFITKAEEDPIIDREMVDTMASAYLGDRDRKTPLASPFYADLRGLPPLLLQVGTAEVLLDDSLGFAERAKAAGVDVTLRVWDDVPHVWQMFASFLPEGQQAIEESGEFIRKHVE
jgi:acetyl esterase/lipase